MRTEAVPPRPRLADLLPDARRVDRRDLVIALARPWPPVVGFIAAASAGWWPVAAVAVAFVFAATVVVVHDLFHRNLPIAPRTNGVLTTVYGALLLNSGHALAASHRHHHRVYPAAGDPEAYVDGWPLWRVVLEGPRYRFTVWSWALRHARADRRVIAAEMLGCVTIWVTAAVLGTRAPVLLGYVVLAEVGSWMFPLISVTGVHDRHAPTALQQTRTLRAPWIGRLLLGMQYHLEHHLYPRVPACRLRELATALDPWLSAREAAVWHPTIRPSPRDVRRQTLADRGEAVPLSPPTARMSEGATSP